MPFKRELLELSVGVHKVLFEAVAQAGSGAISAAILQSVREPVYELARKGQLNLLKSL